MWSLKISGIQLLLLWRNICWKSYKRLLYFCPLFTWHCSSGSIPMKIWHLAKVAYAGWTNSSGWPGWPASYPTSVRWHPFIVPVALVGRMHAQIQNNISESVQTNLHPILDPELVYYYSQVLIKIVKVCSFNLNKGSIWTSWNLWVIYSSGGTTTTTTMESISTCQASTKAAVVVKAPECLKFWWGQAFVA